MSSKEKFMEYAMKRIREKELRHRQQINDINAVQVEGFERCARGRWRAGQR